MPSMTAVLQQRFGVLWNVIYTFNSVATMQGWWNCAVRHQKVDIRPSPTFEIWSVLSSRNWRGWWWCWWEEGGKKSRDVCKPRVCCFTSSFFSLTNKKWRHEMSVKDIFLHLFSSLNRSTQLSSCLHIHLYIHIDIQWCSWLRIFTSITLDSSFTELRWPSLLC